MMENLTLSIIKTKFRGNILLFIEPRKILILLNIKILPIFLPVNVFVLQERKTFISRLSTEPLDTYSLILLILLMKTLFLSIPGGCP